MKNLLKNKTAWSLSLLLAASYSVPFAMASHFTDVPNSYWANQYIEYLANNNKISGYPDNTFHPNAPVTRAEFAAMLAATQALPLSARVQSTYFDVPSSDWAARAIEAASKKGWISGYPGNRFMPNQAISMTELYNVAANITAAHPLNNTEAERVLSQFRDNSSVPRWARPGVATVVQNGIYINELDTNRLYPNEQASRAKVAAVLAKLSNSDFIAHTPLTNQHTATVQEFQGTLTATANPGEWLLVTPAGKQYQLQNVETFRDRPWFTHGSPVTVKASLDNDMVSATVPVLQVEKITGPQAQDNWTHLVGTLRPSTTRPGVWQIVTNNNQVFQLLNPEAYKSQSWFAYGTRVTVDGNVRSDIIATAEEGTPLFLSNLTPNTNVISATDVSGVLKATTPAGGWIVEVPDSNISYVLLDVPADAQSQTWFRNGAVVNLKGTIRRDIPTIYGSGPVLQVTEVIQNPTAVVGTQTVKIYFPNMVGDLLTNTQPVNRVVMGPNIPEKSIEALLLGPTPFEVVQGYYQNKAAQNLILKDMMIRDGQATVVLKSQSPDLDNRVQADLKLRQQLGLQIQKTLSQFPGISTVDSMIEMSGSSSQKVGI